MREVPPSREALQAGAPDVAPAGSAALSGALTPTAARGLAGLRVAYVAFEGFPNTKGSGTRISQLTRGLAAAGADVQLLTLSAKPGALELPIGVSHTSLKLLEDNYLARGLGFRDRVLRELVALRPDVIHFRGVFEGEAALAYAAEHRVPTVFEVNGLPSVELPYHYRKVADSPVLLGKLRALEQRLLRGVGSVVTQSQTTLAFLSSRGLLSSTPQLVLPNAADPNVFRAASLSAAAESSAGGSPPKLLYVGATQAWQGIAELLMAERRLLRELPVTLDIVGPIRKSWRKQIERMLHRLKLTESVALLGPLTGEALVQAIQQSTLCVAPLRRDVRNKHQGCSPIKLFEYMSAGRVVVSTDLPCVREIITPGETGVLLESPRPKLLAEELGRVLSQPEMCARIGAAARQYVLQYASWAQRQRALVSFYQAAVIGAR